MTLNNEFYLKDELEQSTDYVETVGRDVDENAVNKIRRWKKGIDNGSTDPVFQDIEAMEAFHMTWKDLMALPEHVYLSMHRIYGLKAKREMQLQAQQQAAMNYGQ